MGFLDFLYKKPERPQNFRGPRYRSAPTSGSNRQHYQKRTAVYVNSNRPNHSNQDDDYYNGRQSSNNKRQSQNHRNHPNAGYANNGGSGSNSSTADDYTRLSRLEIRVDNFIKRYNEISDELAHIEANLAQIYQEFEDDFKENIVDKTNKYTVEVGNRVLNKLSPYMLRTEIKAKDNVADTDSVDAIKNANREYRPVQSQKSQESESIYSQPSKKVATNNNNDRVSEIKSKPARSNEDYQNGHNVHNVHNNQNNHNNHNVHNVHNNHKNHNNHNNHNIEHHNHHANNQNPSTLHPNEEFSLNITEIAHNQNNNPQKPMTTNANIGQGEQLVRAQYAIVNSTPYSDNGHAGRNGRDNHYQSTPTIPHTGQPMAQFANNQSQYGTMSQYDINRDYGSASPSSQAYGSESGRPSSKLYLNMSSAMHSGHPTIDNCFRYIEMLRPRIMGYKSEHKLRVYQEMDSEIMQLMDRLDTIDCQNDETFLHERKIAKCELHNLTGILERSIECNDPECSICNVIVYKQEVSV